MLNGMFIVTNILNFSNNMMPNGIYVMFKLSKFQITWMSNGMSIVINMFNISTPMDVK